MVRRKKGKYNTNYTSRFVYKSYVKMCRSKGKEPIKEPLFNKIRNACNKEIIHQQIYNSEIVRLPFRLGYLKVTKFEKSFNNKLCIDWKKTKEHGFRVFFEDDFIYKWEWIKKTSIVRNKSHYKFLASRIARKELAQAIKSKKVDYYGRVI